MFVFSLLFHDHNYLVIVNANRNTKKSKFLLFKSNTKHDVKDKTDKQTINKNM